LNKCSNPITSIVDGNFVTKRIILGATHDSNVSKSPQKTHSHNCGPKKIETRQYVAQQPQVQDKEREKSSTVLSRVINMPQNNQNAIFESSPIARRVTNHGKGTLYFDNTGNLASILSDERENMLEVSSGSMDVNSVARPVSKSPVVPRLNYNDVNKDRYEDSHPTLKYTTQNTN
jgi:hypothetical protein